MPPVQPIQPVQQPQAPASYDFTQQQPPAQAPVYQQPVATAVDPNVAQLTRDMAEIKTALGALAPAQQEPPLQQQGQPQATERTYDQWGAVFEDTAKQAQDIVDRTLADRAKQDEAARSAAQQQDQQNQQYIDNTVTQLRNAGYLPPVTNQFDGNDQGKQAENELLGYAISLGSTDLVRAAQELKFRHDAGFKFDNQTKQFIQVNAPNSQDPNAMMFGNLPQTPDGQTPQQPFATQQPQFQPQQQSMQPYGPQNPYMQAPQQYPAGFNAPVSSGGSFQGMQGQTPPLKAIRGNSYDALVDQFNRTQ